MTNEEAIEILKKNKPTGDVRECGKELCKAVDTAITALERCNEIEAEAENLYSEADTLIDKIVKAKLEKNDDLYRLCAFEMERFVIKTAQFCGWVKGEAE